MTRPPGTVYMLHFTAPFGHARHYVGWARDLDARITAHRDGRGARLVAVITAAGIGFTVARTVPGDRTLERAIKRAGGATRYCPICTPRPRGGNWVAKPEVAA